MKPFEITTPVLLRAMENFEAATDGTVEHQEAMRHIAAGRGLVSVVGQELKVRLAAPRIAAAEAKLIEASSPRQIAAAA